MKLKASTIGLALLCAATPNTLARADDASFQSQFPRQYARVADLEPDMLVEELRLSVEKVSSRGSQVGAASNERRVRGFESVLLRELQSKLCSGGSWQGRLIDQPATSVTDSVKTAAEAQRLRTSEADIAELTAIAQRLVESQSERLCALKSLDDIE